MIDDRPAPVWSAVVVLNAVLGVVAAFAVAPWLVVVADPLWGVDPTLVDDGLGIWAYAGVLLAGLYAALAIPLNLWVVRRAGLRGRRAWALVAVLVTLAVAVPVSLALFPPLWQEYAVGLDYGGPVDLN